MGDAKSMLIAKLIGVGVGTILVLLALMFWGFEVTVCLLLLDLGWKLNDIKERTTK